MPLPNADRALIDERKLTDYLLSESHPIGRFKAKFFRALGFESSNSRALRDALLSAALTGEVHEVVESQFGQEYVLFARLVGPGGRSADVATIWIVPRGEDRPHLVTVYPR